MSTVAEQPGRPAGWRERLRPVDDDHGGRGRLYRAESIILALIALILAVATVYDVVRQVHISERTHADLASWEAITGRHDRRAIVEQDAKTYTTRDVVCGRTAAFTRSAPVAFCLIFQGPVRAGRREATGGYYVLKSGRRRNQVVDKARYRYGCFGTARALGYRCALAPPRGAPDTPL